MNSFALITDSGCDLSPEILKELNIECAYLTVQFEGSNEEHTNLTMPIKEFYAKMRAGKVAKTASVNIDTFGDMFEHHAKEGRDVLYLGFSSALSGTYNAAIVAAREIGYIYLERKILALDTLSASAGVGLLLYEAARMRDEGRSAVETADHIRRVQKNMCHWFTVDSLSYLKRSGRVSAPKALFASVLNIRPVLHMDDAGFLVGVNKVRGRKKSVEALADKYFELAQDPETQEYAISHADCLEDAETLQSLIEAKNGRKAKLITDVGPMIGAHAGPGTLALFFFGRNR